MRAVTILWYPGEVIIIFGYLRVNIFRSIVRPPFSTVMELMICSISDESICFVHHDCLQSLYIKGFHIQCTFLLRMIYRLAITQRLSSPFETLQPVSGPARIFKVSRRSRLQVVYGYVGKYFSE